MLLYFDQNQGLVYVNKTGTLPTDLHIKKGDQLPLRIGIIRQGVLRELAPFVVLEFGVKKLIDDLEFICVCESFTFNPDTRLYEGVMDCGTEEVADALGLLNVLPVFADLKVQGAGYGPVWSQTLPITLDRNVITGDEGSPTHTPDADDFVAARAVLYDRVQALSSPQKQQARDNVDLGNVNNTSDANKPVSTAQQTAFNLKANLASPALTGVPTAPTAVGGTSTIQIATTAFVAAAVGSVTFPVTSVQGRTGAVVITKGDVGLGNVENTALSTWAGSGNITTLGTITSGAVPVARISGLGGAAILNVGTTAGTVAAGDDPRFVTTAADVASVIHGATSKTAPVDADEIPLADSAASFGLKKLTWANLKATVKSYFDTVYAAIVHTHVSADITDATSTATPDTLALRGSTGSVEFASSSNITPAIKGTSTAGAPAVSAFSSNSRAVQARNDSASFATYYGFNFGGGPLLQLEVSSGIVFEVSSTGAIVTGTIAAGSVSGLGNSATLDVGTTAGTVAAGDDPRFGAGANTAFYNAGTYFTGETVTLNLADGANQRIGIASSDITIALDSVGNSGVEDGMLLTLYIYPSGGDQLVTLSGIIYYGNFMPFPRTLAGGRWTRCQFEQIQGQWNLVGIEGNIILD